MPSEVIMFFPLRRFGTQLLLLGSLLGLGYWTRDIDLRATSLTAASPVPSTTPSPPPQQTVTAQKIGEGQFADPQTLAVTQSGVLLALDHGPAPAVRRFAADGSQLPSLPLPPTLLGPNAPNMVAAGPGDSVYLARSRFAGIWKLQGTQAQRLDTDLIPAALASRNGVLFVLGHERQGIVRIDGQQATTIAFSTFPERGYFSQLRLRANGDFYVYASEERLVWRFDKNGKLLEKIGGGGEAPPKVNLTADYLGRYYDVDDNGDVYWTLGDYGTLLKIDHATGIATRYSERGGNRPAWLGNIASLSGFQVHGEKAFVFDRSLKRITGLPLAWAKPDAPGTQSIDSRAFGFDFRVESNTPYKLFTTPRVQLKTTFNSGNRKLRTARLVLTVRDFTGRAVAAPTITPTFTDSAAASFDVPVFELPRLGWYQIEAALYTDESQKQPLLTRAHYITRTLTDPAQPIPANEQTGWDDLDTPRLAGMRLHRYSLHRPNQIEEFEANIRNARKIGMPYFTLLINKRDCTPENARYIVEKLKAFGDEEPLIELLNEPNLTMSAAEYVKLLRACRDAIKQANPRARIMGPVQCGTDLNWLEAFFRAGGGELIDVVSLHTYEQHNSMDAWHWNWKFAKIRELLKQYNSQDKPLYQTEHGFLGAYAARFVRPQWQANQLLLEKLVLDRFGIDDSRYFYYYVNESGYREFNAYVVNQERELLPAASMMRIRRHLLQDARFVRALDFPAPGDRLLTVNLYRNEKRDVVILQNNGALDPITLQAQLPSGSRLFDCWGNPLPVSRQVAVGRTPLYLHLPRQAAFELRLPPAGRNIAAQARISVDDAKGQQSVSRLTNGLLEFDFLNQPEKVGFLASDNALPLDLTLEWSAPHSVSSVVLYGSLADNDKSTPLAYELWARQNGTWRKVATIDQKPATRFFRLGNSPALTDYENPWLVRHLFGSSNALVADGLRFRFTRTTFGHYPTQAMAQDIGSRLGQNFAPRVELREIEVYTAS